MRRVVCIKQVTKGSWLDDHGIIFGRSYELVNETDNYWEIVINHKTFGLKNFCFAKTFEEFKDINSLRKDKLKRLEWK